MAPVPAPGCSRRPGSKSRQSRTLPATPSVDAALAWLALIQGDVVAAGAWLQRSGLRVNQDLDPIREREYLTGVRVLLRLGRLEEAGQWLAKLLPLAEGQGRIGSMIEIFLLQAEARQAAGAGAEAVARLAHALALAEPEGYIRLFVDEGAAIAQLLGQMRRRPPEEPPGASAYHEQLLALLGGAPDAPVPLASEARAGVDKGLLGEPLSEREREILRLIVAGYSN